MWIRNTTRLSSLKRPADKRSVQAVSQRSSWTGRWFWFLVQKQEFRFNLFSQAPERSILISRLLHVDPSILSSCWRLRPDPTRSDPIWSDPTRSDLTRPDPIRSALVQAREVTGCPAFGGWARPQRRWGSPGTRISTEPGWGIWAAARTGRRNPSRAAERRCRWGAAGGRPRPGRRPGRWRSRCTFPAPCLGRRRRCGRLGVCWRSDRTQSRSLQKTLLWSEVSLLFTESTPYISVIPECQWQDRYRTDGPYLQLTARFLPACLTLHLNQKPGGNQNLWHEKPSRLVKFSLCKVIFTDLRFCNSSGTS